MELDLQEVVLLVGKRSVTARELTMREVSSRGRALTPILLYARFLPDIRKGEHIGEVAAKSLALLLKANPREAALAFSACCIPRPFVFGRVRRAIRPKDILRATPTQMVNLLNAVLLMNGWASIVVVSGGIVSIDDAVIRLMRETGWSMDSILGYSPRQIGLMLSGLLRERAREMLENLAVTHAAKPDELQAELLCAAGGKRKKEPVDGRDAVANLAEMSGDHKAARKMRVLKQASEILADIERGEQENNRG